MTPRVPTPKHSLNLISRFASEFINRLSSFIVFPLMIKYLSAEAYGVNTQIQTLSSYLLTFAGLGLGFYVIREYAGKLETRVLSKRFWSSVLLVSIASIALGSVLLFLPDQINQIFFRVSWANPVIQWGFGLVFFSAIEQVIRDFLRARLRMVAYSVSQIVQAIVYVLGVSAILLNSGSLLQIIQLTVMLRAVSGLGMVIFLLVVGEVGIIGGINSIKEQMEIVRWGLPIVASSLSVAFISTGDRAILGALTDSVSVGIYGASYQLANIILAIGAPFWSMLYPLMATFKNLNDLDGLTRVTRKYSNTFVCIGLPVFFGLLILGAPTLGYFGESLFELPVHVFLFILLGVFVSQFCAPILYLAYIYQSPKTIFAITTASALTNSILNFLLIPYLGIYAAALNTTFTYALMDFLLIRLIPSTGLKESNIYDYKNLLRYAISGILMGILLLFLREKFVFSLETLLFMVLISAGGYFLVLFALYGFRLSRMLKPIFN